MFFYDKEYDDNEDPLGCFRGVCGMLPAALAAWAVVIAAVFYLAGRA